MEIDSGIVSEGVQYLDRVFRYSIPTAVYPTVQQLNNNANDTTSVEQSEERGNKRKRLEECTAKSTHTINPKKAASLESVFKSGL